jgi:hypothetical protein
MLEIVRDTRRMTHTSEPTPPADPDDYVFTFKPAPSLTSRHDGWSEERQRRLVWLLREYGVVSRAVGMVGCSAQSAYRLRTRTGAEEFAAAWDRALTEARDRAFDLAVDRARNGVSVPRFYRGNYTGMSHRYDNRLAMAALNAADRAPRIDRKVYKGEK